MLLNKLLLFIHFVVHLLFLVVFHFRFYEEKIVTYVPTDMRLVSSMARTIRATCQGDGLTGGLGVRAIDVSPQIGTPARATETF